MSPLWAGDLSDPAWEDQHGQVYNGLPSQTSLDATGVDGIAPTILVTASSVTAQGADRRWFIPNTSIGETMEAATLEYQVYIEAGFDFGGGGKLPGFGGKLPLSETVFSMSWGGVRYEDSWTNRLLFSSTGFVAPYLYAQSPLPGDIYGYSGGFTSVRLEEGMWNTVRMRAEMNTPGSADGVLKMWVNDYVVCDLSNVLYRTADYPTLGVSAMLVNFGYGGDASDAPAADQDAHFAGFKLYA